jgi:hypothetical protein|tara:strand:+ start:59 stop:469 length:411 start_codon:yes stop_codon:yes gene_type:complete
MNSISKELSELSTGMVLTKTKVSTDKRQGVIEEINIFPLRQQFQIKYRVERMDASGNAFTDVLYKSKVMNFKDEGEKGTITYIETTDKNGMLNSEPNWETYVMTEAENLYVTNWNAQIGNSILGSAIAHIELLESI